ncbi:MAG: PEGA domain-containing protein [Myxococcales bacterium]
MKFTRTWRGVLLQLGLVLTLGLAPWQTASAEGRGTPSGARAESGTKRKAPETAEQANFQKILRQAVAEFELGNWTEARALFERAHELSPSARTFRAMGLCAFEEKSYVASLVYLTKALEDTRKPLNDDERKKLADVIGRARSFVGSFVFEVTPTDAEIKIDLAAPVFVDGKVLLDPGNHELTVSAPGYQDETRRLSIKPREDAVINIALKPNAPAEPQVVVTPKPSTPQPDKSVEPTRPPRAGLSIRRKAGLVSAAVGVASLAAGVTLGVLAKQKNDQSGCDHGSCPSQAAKRTNDHALRLANGATVTFAIAGAAIAAGAFLYFWPTAKRDEAKPAALSHLRPELAPGFAGARWEATW